MNGRSDHAETRRAPFLCGDWAVSPDTNHLSRGAQSVPVEPRVMDVLCLLADRAGQVVDSDELIREVWSGTVVGDDAVYRAVGQLRKALGDRAAGPTYVQTIPKRGYRLIADVRPEPSASPATVSGLAPGQAASASSPAHTRGLSKLRWQWLRSRRLLALALVILVAGSLYLVMRWQSMPAGGPFASIAVLPLANASADPDGVHFADGLSQELILTLSKVPGLKVVSRASSFQFKGVERDLREVGKWLGVEAVLEGSVRRNGDRVRVDVFLADTSTGFEVWSRSFDRPSSALIDLEKSIAREVVQILDQRLLTNAPDKLTGGDTANLEAYDYFLLGVGHGAERKADNLERAGRMFERAIQLDPKYARAHAGLAGAILLGGYYGHGPFHDALARARPVVDKALQLGPEDATVWGVVGLLHYLQDDSPAALPAFKHSLARNPGLAVVHMWRGLAVEQVAGPNAAQVHFERALELDPLNTTAVENLALNQARRGQLEESVNTIEKMLVLQPASQQLYRVLAQLNGQRGMLAQSLTFARRAEAFDPGGPITLAELARAYAHLGELAQAAAALRRAEPSTTDNQGLLQALDPVYLATGDWEEYERLAEAVLQIATAADEASDDHRLRRSLARLGTAKFMLGDHQDAAQLLSRALSGNPAVISRPDVDTFFCSNLAHAYLALARHEDAKRTVLNCDERLQRAKTQGWRTSWIPYGEARIRIADGDRDAAVAALLALERTGAGVYFILDRDPIIATLRDDPEVAALLERMHEKVREERSKAQILAGS